MKIFEMEMVARGRVEPATALGQHAELHSNPRPTNAWGNYRQINPGYASFRYVMLSLFGDKTRTLRQIMSNYFTRQRRTFSKFLA